MIFVETSLHGAFISEPQLLEDERGFFARSWCQHEFEAHGLDPHVVQSNISFNRVKGTLRGMHYQVSPFAEAKVVRCARGAIYDVIIDLRPDSPTFCRWIAHRLHARELRMLYVPKGFAHGFQTIEDDSEVTYQMSAAYSPAHARGIRWDDQLFAIKWPLPEPILSEKDRSYPDFQPSAQPVPERLR